MLQQSIEKSTVSTITLFNSLVGDAKKHAGLKIKFFSIPLEDIIVMAWCDASFANVLDKPDDDVALKSQAGYVLGYAPRSVLQTKRGLVSVAAWLSHKIKRKVRSTLAAETLAGNESLEAADILRCHLYGAIRAEPIDRRRWRECALEVPVALPQTASLCTTFCTNVVAPRQKRGCVLILR